MKRINLIWAIILISTNAFAVSYSVATIPDSLKLGANAVYRLDQFTYRILAANHSIERSHIVVTILNGQGKRLATEMVQYDKQSTVRFFTTQVYDAQGVLVRKFKNSEIQDYAASGSSLYEDDRVKVVDASQPTYPYTVEFEYEVERNYMLHIPSWAVLSHEKVSVVHSEYTLEFPKEIAPRYMVLNTPDRVSKGMLKDGYFSYSWSFSNIKPLSFEESSPLQEVTPIILAAPIEFEYSGYAGNMNSWQAFGQWIQKLNQGRSQLTEATQRKVQDLIRNIKTDEEKAAILYRYLQEKTRYVSIQLGIGGYQPFEASQVDQSGYGDCKALSNYMVSLLNAAGIDANYVLIRAGEDSEDIETRFPASQFNHVIVAVPNKGDTLWLECTSQTNPFGYLGRFTGDRHALLINRNGGQIVKTPAYRTEINVQSRRAEVNLLPSGDAMAKVRTMYSGLQYENGRLDNAINSSYNDQKEWVNKTTQIPNFEVTRIKMSGTYNKVPRAYVELDLDLKRLASVSGKRLFVSPNLMNRSTYVPGKLERRRSDIVEDFGYVDYDTIAVNLPENLYPEFMPAPIKIQSRFGAYDASFSIKEGLVIYTRSIRIEKGRFPKETYPEYIEFYKNINKADNIKLVFLNKT